MVRKNYRIGVPRKGKLKEIFNSDLERYQGSNVLNTSQLKVESSPYDGRDYSVELLVPPLSVTVFKIL